MMDCSICQNSQGNRKHAAREMMFGLREEFCYEECANCGCLRLVDIPDDLSRFYPSNYFSFAPARELSHWSVRRLARKQLAGYYFNRMNPVGRVLAARFPEPNTVSNTVDWMKRSGAQTDSRILDVGSGSGSVLLAFAELGFSHLLGIDPYIDHSVTYPSGVTILKQSLAEVLGSFDLVMLHHVFEHMSDSRTVLRTLAKLLAPRGCILIRTPVSDSFAWRTYGTDWVQLDAPRHLVIHTRKSIDLLGNQSGLCVSEVVYDSTEFQFLGSEQYRRDIPLRDGRSWLEDSEPSICTPAELGQFREQARDLNAQCDGDQAAFYLRLQ